MVKIVHVQWIVDLKIFNYTDWHDIDEDRRTICNAGGTWDRGTMSGIIQQSMYDTPTKVYSGVASRVKNEYILKS